MLRKANVELTQIMIIDKFLIHRTIVCLVPIGRNDLWIAISLALKSSFYLTMGSLPILLLTVVESLNPKSYLLLTSHEWHLINIDN